MNSLRKMVIFFPKYHLVIGAHQLKSKKCIYFIKVRKELNSTLLQLPFVYIALLMKRFWNRYQGQGAGTTA